MAIDASTNIRSSMKNLLLLATLVSIPALAQEESIELSLNTEVAIQTPDCSTNQAFSTLSQLQLIEYGLQQLLETDAPLITMWQRLNFYRNSFFSLDETAQSAYTLELSKSIPSLVAECYRKLLITFLRTSNAMLLYSYGSDQTFAFIRNQFRALEDGFRSPTTSLLSRPITSLLENLGATLDHELLRRLQMKEATLLILLADRSADFEVPLLTCLTIRAEYTCLFPEINFLDKQLYRQYSTIVSYCDILINHYTQLFQNQIDALSLLLSKDKDIEFLSLYRQLAEKLQGLSPSLPQEHASSLEDRLGSFYYQFIAQIQAEIEALSQSEFLKQDTLDSNQSLWDEISLAARSCNLVKDPELDEQLVRLIEQFLKKFDQDVSTLTTPSPSHPKPLRELSAYISLFEDGPVRMIFNEQIRALHIKLTAIYQHLSSQ